MNRQELELLAAVSGGRHSDAGLPASAFAL
jgi:hypothetical protein